jgi:hypothetical protein
MSQVYSRVKIPLILTCNFHALVPSPTAFLDTTLTLIPEIIWNSPQAVFLTGPILAHHCKIITLGRSLERPHEPAETIRRSTLPCTDGLPQGPLLVVELTYKQTGGELPVLKVCPASVTIQAQLRKC